MFKDFRLAALAALAPIKAVEITGCCGGNNVDIDLNFSVNVVTPQKSADLGEEDMGGDEMMMGGDSATVGGAPIIAPGTKLCVDGDAACLADGGTSIAEAFPSWMWVQPVSSSGSTMMMA